MIKFLENLLNSGVLDVAGVVLTYFASMFLHTKHKQVKNQYVLNLMEQGAKWIVASSAQNVALSSSERFEKGKNYLLSIAKEHNMQFLDTTISGMLERAYQQYKSNGGDIHFQTQEDIDRMLGDTADNSSNQGQPTATQEQPAPKGAYKGDL